MRHVGRPRNARHVALGLGIGRRPPGTILVALRERLRQVWNLAVGRVDIADPGRNRRDGPEPRELRQIRCRVRLEIPVGRHVGLPEPVEIGPALETTEVRSGGLRRGIDGRSG